MENNKENYNDEPVFYCKHCLSLRIKAVPGMEGLDYCDDCGATEVAQAHISIWEQMYRDKHGFNYIEKY